MDRKKWANIAVFAPSPFSNSTMMTPFSFVKISHLLVRRRDPPMDGRSDHRPRVRPFIAAFLAASAACAGRGPTALLPLPHNNGRNVELVYFVFRI